MNNRKVKRTREQKFNQQYKNLVADFAALTPPKTEHQKKLLVLIAKINGGDSTNPTSLFDLKTARLKSVQQLHDLCFHSLQAIIPKNTRNGEVSLLLSHNLKQFKEQGWSPKGDGDDARSSSETEVLDTETARKHRKKILRLPKELRLTDCFSKSFDLIDPEPKSQSSRSR